MKVLHISTSQTGGAALCAIRICKALTIEGIDSRMLLAEGSSMPEGITGAIAIPDNIFWNKNPFLKAIKKLLRLFGIWLVDVEKTKKWLKKANKTNEFVQQPLSYFKNIETHPLVEWADIIHLHYVCDFIDYPTFFKIVNKPIIWTLHDKYPAMGVMHFSSKFRPLPDELKSIDTYCRIIKREGVSKARNLNIVAISEFMVDFCKNSYVLKGFPITLIHNGVDTTIFHPSDKQEARKRTGLQPDAVIFLFSSFFMDDPNKGIDRAVAALEIIDVPNKVLVCLGGLYEKVHIQSSFPVIFAGRINDPIQISLYYSSADYFLQCSYEETFSQTPLEAMACGIPVITTPCSGAKDIVQPFNGVLCKGYDENAIAEGIKEAMDKQYYSDIIRQHIVDNFNYNIIAKQYIKLYTSLHMQ